MEKIKKVTFPKDYKRYFTLEDMEICKHIIKEITEGRDDNKLDFEWELKSGTLIATDCKLYGTSILKAEAEFAHNSRVYDYYYDGSRNIDILFKIYAYNAYYGFYDIMIYLSDIWQYSSGSGNPALVHHCTPDKR